MWYQIRLPTQMQRTGSSTTQSLFMDIDTSCIHSRISGQTHKTSSCTPVSSAPIRIGQSRSDRTNSHGYSQKTPSMLFPNWLIMEYTSTNYGWVRYMWFGFTAESDTWKLAITIGINGECPHHILTSNALQREKN